MENNAYSYTPDGAPDRHVSNLNVGLSLKGEIYARLIQKID